MRFMLAKVSKVELFSAEKSPVCYPIILCCIISTEILMHEYILLFIYIYIIILYTVKEFNI